MAFGDLSLVAASLRGLHPARTHSIHTLIKQAQPLPTAIHEALAPFKTNTIRPEKITMTTSVAGVSEEPTQQTYQKPQPTCYVD